MAKKMNAKEQRLAKKQSQLEKFKQHETERKNMAEQAKNRETEEQNKRNEEHRKALIGTSVPYSKNNNAKQKSLAKASGLKSVFVVDDEVYLTSFGKGNSAVLEKNIKQNQVININIEKPKFSAKLNEYNEQKIDIRSTRVNKDACADKPSGSVIKQDYIHAKDILEMKYFGQTFTDNIHIQLIYNILDIEKILAVHINNIILAVDNIFRRENAEYKEDFLGYISTMLPYDKFMHSENYPELSKYQKGIEKNKEGFLELMRRPQLGYFGDTFTSKNGKERQIRAYSVLALMGSVRQSCFHQSQKLENNKRTDAWLYNLGDKDIMADEFRETLDAVYKERFNSVNRDFMKTSGINVLIAKNAIDSVFSPIDMQKLVEEYYRFTVTKEYKNLGFSIKRLRETMMEFDASAKLKGKVYDSVRSKLYKTIDFLIYYYYTFIEPQAVEENVDILRSKTTEDDKNAFYTKEAKRIWANLGNGIMNQIASDVLELPKKHKEELDLSKEYSVRGISVIPDACYFSKLIYLMTKLLDGKEINDLLTTLIHKFDNIQSFMDTMEQINMRYTFTNDYHFFEDSKHVCEELKIINNVARMTKPDANARKVMYREAIDILGMHNKDITEEEIESIINDMLGVDGNGNKTKGKNKHGLRNFIASNVIDSDRFKYLVRYTNSKKVRKLAENRALVLFALRNLPDEQIRRYYTACVEKKNFNVDEQRVVLADKITAITFDEFKYVDNKAHPNAKTAASLDKQQKQALIGLYLTIMYHITKNLIYVNSRYVIAFHCLERDGALLDSNAGWFGVKDIEPDHAGLTKSAIEKGYINKHAATYLEQNISNSEGKIIGFYRNNVAHLSVIRNADLYVGDIKEFRSYFELYHYIMQCMLMNGCKNQSVSHATEKYFVAVEKYKTYSKDFVKALNVPFGYNLARYKNLSIEPLFDKNNMRLERENREERTIIQ